MSGLRMCTRCGWFHVGLTREAIERQAREFGAYIATASPEDAALFGLGPLARTPCEWTFEEHVGRSMRCFSCGAPHTEVRAAREHERPRAGCTLQGIMVPDA